MEKKKQSKQIILLILGILVASGVTVALAWRLYQLRSQPIAPTAPPKVPAADNAAPQCTLDFVVPSPTPGPSATPTPTGTPGPTNTPTPTGTPGPTATPTLTPSPTPTGTPGPTATPTPTSTPEPTATPTPTETPGPTNTPAPEPTATSTPTPIVYQEDTPTPTRVELYQVGDASQTIFALLFGGIVTGLAILLAL